ncbi:BMC domain-containing protein [Leptolyngbya iicbica]|uniref:BMC domain-containing protein n=2 Tax=Cyanophyceae TaxID=3028117 RepID=A0A4Q7EKZ1_9CYAN|nr:BMC domain-containing protein [Leptolyngbya sp. LK]RZM82479.1 BMC domain-containing protein [Leptolyngbya sp. LK]
MQQAIGVVETCGMPGALVIADIMGKSANIRVVGLENTDSGRISVIIRGSTGALQAAIAAAQAAQTAHPSVSLLGHHIVPCPDNSVEPMGQPRPSRRFSQSNSVEWLDD